MSSEHCVAVRLMVFMSCQSDQTFVSLLCGLTVLNDFGVVTRLRAGPSGVRIPAGQEILYGLQTVQTGNLLSIHWVPGFFRGKADGAWSCHLRLASMFRMSGAIPLLPLWVLMAWTETVLRLTIDSSSVYCLLLEGMQLTCTAWVESFDTSDDGQG
jgi:hypothetical protein